MFSEQYPLQYIGILGFQKAIFHFSNVEARIVKMEPAETIDLHSYVPFSSYTPVIAYIISRQY